MVVTAQHSQVTSLATSKTVIINIAYPPVKITFIDGCNRLFSVQNSITLTAQLNLQNTTGVHYNWYCTEKQTGSPCFNTGYEYINLADQ